MKLNTPRWWYTRDARHGMVARTLLKPLSWIWGAATARRIARAVPVDPGVPIISVGDLTVGGSGKTPVTREAVRLLHEAGTVQPKALAAAPKVGRAQVALGNGHVI